MTADQTDLLSAFDSTIAAVARLEATDMRTSSGASAQPLLQRLRADLEARRREVATGGALDREWAGGLVRWVAEWVPERELPLIARLGHIVRLGAGG
jgi:hypothetical protein